MTSKVDIANDVQKGIGQANRKNDEDPANTASTEADRATRFDGNPQPDGDSKPGVFKPRDDTPWRLEKKSGPKEP